MAKKLSVFVLIILSVIYFLLRDLTSNELYVSSSGNDSYSGRSQLKPLKTIQRAVDLAKPGTTIKVFPGIYRESILINLRENSTKPLRIISLNKNGNRAHILGSEPSQSLSWNRCTTEKCKGLDGKYLHSVYYADINWSESPGIIVQKTQSGDRMLTIARSPNYNVKNTSRYLEFLWKGENTTPSASLLVDQTQLKTASDFSGATAVLVDGDKRCGQLIYSAPISKHDTNSGALHFDKPIGFSFLGSQEAGIGKATRYFIQGKIELLDEAGEWAFDENLKRLYLWPLEGKNPAKEAFELGRRPYGIKVLNGSNISIEGFVIENINGLQSSDEEGAITLSPPNKMRVQDIHVKNVLITNSMLGIIAIRKNDTQHLSNILLEKTVLKKIIRKPIFAFNFNGFSVKKSEISNSSHFSNYNAITVNRLSNVKIEGNYIHNVGANGILFLSNEDKNIASKKIYVTGNKINHACESLGTCSGIKFFDGKYENTLVQSNTITDTYGWSPCLPFNGIGLMISNASGIKVVNNKFQDNLGIGIFLYTRQLPSTNNQVVGNIVKGSQIGILLDSSKKAFDANPKAISTRHDSVVIYKNVFGRNETALKVDPAHPEKVVIDENTYTNNNWSMNFRGTQLKTPGDITKNFPFWENRFRQ